MLINLKRLTLFLLAAILTLVSCRKDLSNISTAEWKPSVTLPFIQTELRLGDIMPQDSNLYTLPDSSFYYSIHQDSLFTMDADSLLNLAGQSLDTAYTFSMGELSIDTFSMASTFSLDDMMPYFPSEVRDTLLKYDQKKTIFPVIHFDHPFTVALPPVDLYQTLTFSHGFINIIVKNTLPVTLQNISYSLNDEASGTLLKSFLIAQLAPGETYSDSLSLKGLTLGNVFSFVVNSYNSDGSYPDSVLINLSQGLAFNLRAHDIKVIRGMAKIPQQIMYSDFKTIDLNLENGEKLYQLIFKSGNLSYFIQSELSVRLYIEIKLLSGLNGGVIPHADVVLNPHGTFSDSWNMHNTQLFLNTDPTQPYNRFPVRLNIVVLPTNEIVSLDSADHVIATFTSQELKPFYAEGYFGKKSVNIPTDTLAFHLDFLQKLQGNLLLDHPVMKLSYRNGFGIPVKIFPKLMAINSASGSVVDLGLDSLTFDYPQTPGGWAGGSFQIDKTNSEIVHFLSVRPNKIVWSGAGITNWNNDTLNFLYDTSTLVAGMDLNIPMVLRATNLQFSDTLKLTTSGGVSPIQSAGMKAIVENGFPFSMHLVLHLADSITGEVLETIALGDIESAPVNLSGKVTQPHTDSLFVNLDENFFRQLKKANRGILSAESSSFGDGTVPVALFSNYRVKVALGFTGKLKP